ncbi:hypothetical protein Afil01_28740 [Actinorhabdospora filicis]|uniref:Uncharacterized protein n=1 Tax=Actinorhabdospora filicis TaxID=1785913 RepID=A0A9W6W3E7_9ACTN|nr:DUF6247 family protein [Actinorhabdospora filicis]GLZ78067.1 hypothetical protein Afil01_28740 [Actinorhabdospora filicis]
MDMLYGPETFERLEWEQRPVFDGEWQAALDVAARDLDLSPLVLLVCRWWCATGGDAARAGRTRTEFARWSQRRKLQGNAVSGPAVCECSGPAIYDVLTVDERAALLASWESAIGEAGVRRDWGGLWGVIRAAYVQTQTTDADRAVLATEMARVEEAARTGDYEAAGLVEWVPTE